MGRGRVLGRGRVWFWFGFQAVTHNVTPVNTVSRSTTVVGFGDELVEFHQPGHTADALGQGPGCWLWRHRNVANSPRVTFWSGSKVVELVPVVTSLASSHSTGAVCHGSVTSTNGEVVSGWAPSANSWYSRRSHLGPGQQCRRAEHVGGFCAGALHRCCAVLLQPADRLLLPAGVHVAETVRIAAGSGRQDMRHRNAAASPRVTLRSGWNCCGAGAGRDLVLDHPVDRCRIETAGMHIGELCRMLHAGSVVRRGGTQPGRGQQHQQQHIQPVCCGVSCC